MINESVTESDDELEGFFKRTLSKHSRQSTETEDIYGDNADEKIEKIMSSTPI
jgi:hypothetical protein